MLSFDDKDKKLEFEIHVKKEYLGKLYILVLPFRKVMDGAIRKL